MSEEITVCYNQTPAEEKPKPGQAETKETLINMLVQAWTPQLRSLAEQEIDSLMRFPEFDKKNVAQYAASAYWGLLVQEHIILWSQTDY